MLRLFDGLFRRIARGRSGPLPYGTREWEWDPSHFPLPLTPAFASCYVGWMEHAFRVTCAAFGIIAETLEVRTRRGYLYIRVKPLGVGRPPPAWLTAIALRLWWVHPVVRRRVRRAVRRMRAGYGDAVLRRWETVWRPAIRAQQRRLRACAWADLTDAALAGRLSDLTATAGTWVTIHFLLHAAISVPLTRLEDFLAAAPTLRDIRAADLLAGASPASGEPARALARVAAPLRERADLVARAADCPPAAALDLLRRESPAFAMALDAYLAVYGQGTVGRYEFIVPTLAEQPAALVPSILRLACGEVEDAAQAGERTARRVEEAAARLRDPDCARRFRALVAAAQRAYAVRDDNVHITFNDTFGLLRTVLLEAGGRLHRRGAIATPDDIFFLRVPETIAALRGQLVVSQAAVRERRARWQAAAHAPPPRSLGRRTPRIDLAGLPPEAREVTHSLIRYMRGILAIDESADRLPEIEAGEPLATGQRASQSGLVLRGIGAVRGRYTGRARVLRGEQDFDRLGAGEVLVCAMTSPAWAAVLPLAGALVTDHGGLLSHAAVIAREFGLPAVVATGEATRVITDGSWVEVDGDLGLVRVLR